ncbi:hypothetical protein RDWZM_008709 [Blomia tropicalis]|uniref:WD repeat-containing protein 74 n=1 Tax=Blomia tropicalis TaxID=40697 RepID=A0A9Q0M2A4_BLOTA|nr:hypothetical protein RDWZM_008709 [Blomia tropicalis]
MTTVMEPTGIIVGDELGQLKKIDLIKKDCTTFKLSKDEQLHPTKCVASISPLSFDLLNNNFLISNKANSLFIYDALTDEINNVNYHVATKSTLVCSQCIDDQNIVIGFKNGAIHRINIEKDLCSAAYKPNNKALNVLGIENMSPENHEGKSKVNLKPSKKANQECLNESTNSNATTIFEPNWNEETTYLSCMKVRQNKLAIGGYNSDLKVFDLNTGQNIFNAKSTNTDWLGITHQIWISGLDWIGNENDSPNLVATCSRTDPNWNNANNESNLPSLTTICSLPSINSTASPSHTVVVGTTLGRMLAFDLRLKTRASKILGGFKGFSGGSIRDIKYVRDSKITCKLYSCSIDRFVRVHTLTKTSRLMDKKFYIKTKPTCLHPIMANTPPIQSDEEEIVDDDDEFY